MYILVNSESAVLRGSTGGVIGFASAGGSNWPYRLASFDAAVVMVAAKGARVDERRVLLGNTPGEWQHESDGAGRTAK